jgi:preprotein translocase SecE subunit
MGDNTPRAGNFLVRAFRAVVEFVGEVKAELVKVAWPSRAEIVASTWVVIVSCIFISIWIFAADTASNAVMATLVGILRR